MRTLPLVLLILGLIVMVWPVVDGVWGSGEWFLELWIVGLPLTIACWWLLRRR